MSRVTSSNQYDRYCRARELYLAFNAVFMLLDPNEQWDMFGFYQPHKDHTPESLRRVQHAASLIDPSLPHRAGKVFARIELLMSHLHAIAAQDAVPRQKYRKGNKRRVSVRSDVIPELDPRAMAEVLVQMALQQAARDQRLKDDEAA